jgi:guanosine-diphosphatase
VSVGVGVKGCGSVSFADLLPLIYSVCEVKPCSFNGVYQPSILDTFPNGQLLALSYFTDRIQPLLAPYTDMYSKSKSGDSNEPISAEVDVSDTKTLSIGTLALMAKDVCAGPKVWKRRWGHDKAAMAELEDRPEYCLDLTFMHGLLGLGESLVDQVQYVPSFSSYDCITYRLRIHRET